LSDIFVSYSRADRARVAPLVKAIEAEGWSVWWDPEITPGEEFDSLISRELEGARSLIVVWTPNSVDSRWVRGEARDAADRGVLVPVRFDNAKLPIDFRALHTTDLDGWNEDASGPAFKSLRKALETLLGPPKKLADAAAKPARPQISICVLPFANMSGDPEQDYFSDGITEDIITDLSKVSSLFVVSRNTAFTFKGKAVEVAQVARQTKSSHVLEGSIRKSGNRVRITAQLIDGASDGHVWAERYDRDLNDIFALQDEISQAIVKALRLKLLPEEKKAIEQRDTTSLDAYNLYLMARQYMLTGNLGDARRSEAIIRLCRRAVEIDPNYARAWALIAVAQMHLRFFAGGTGDNGLAAADRALALDGSLAEAHAARGIVLNFEADYDGAQREIDAALRLAPDSFEANVAAARQSYSLRRFDQAIQYLEKAAEAVETDYWSVGMLNSAYETVGNKEGELSAARRTLERTQKILAVDPNNGSAMGYAIGALASLGEAARAKEMIDRALLLDPENGNMRYNMACTVLTRLKDIDAALDLLEPLFRDMISQQLLNWSKTDPDFDSIRDNPRFKELMAAAEARLASAKDGGVAQGARP
jgi:adenylate cyclase